MHYGPRLVREIEDFETRGTRRIAGKPIEPIALNPDHVAFIRNAMYGVTQEGTSARIFAGAPYKTGGKTGMHRQAVAPANKASADAMPASGTGRIHAGMRHADIHILM